MPTGIVTKAADSAEELPLSQGRHRAVTEVRGEQDIAFRVCSRIRFAEAVERADVNRPAVVLDPDAPTLLASGHVSDAASAVALRARAIRGESVSAYGGGWGNY